MEPSSSNCSSVWMRKFFASAWQAFIALLITLLLLVAVYLGIHCARKQPEVPWSKAVRVSKDGRFQPRFQQAILERFFSEQELIRGKNIIDQRCNEAKDEALTKRRRLFGEVQAFCRQYFSKSPRENLPAYIGQGSTSEKNSEASRMLANLKTLSYGLTQPGGTLGLFEKDAPEWKDEDVLILQISNIVSVLKKGLLDAGAEKREKGNVLLEKLQNQDDHEKRIRDEIEDEIKALEPPLSFIWLYHEGAGWIFEVVFWTWFGVIANSIITVIVKCKNKAYDPDLFSLVIPKFFLAPLLSVIFVSLWAAGVTKEKVTFLNLPWFMALCFFLGFMTETLYTRLRMFAVAFLGGVTELSGKLPGGPGRDYHQWRHILVDVRDLVKPRTLDELKEALEKQAQAEMEHTIVEEKAKESE
ncbi:MAG: hypothetical protein JSW66_05090 [Phycisphaerales bacterium]|nr:MAG: hypothetical protein JSW66_05090 [Phycisphaerales bacterium]